MRMCTNLTILTTVLKASHRWSQLAWPCLRRRLRTPEDMGTITHVVRFSFVHIVSRPHLLAPTASDLVKYNEKDTILAGFHTDLNFLTIHGRSRYPGLHIWARNTGKRLLVQFPPTGRYLLVQAGKQLEHLSGGLIKAGYHEVVVNEPTLAVNSPCYRALVLQC